MHEIAEIYTKLFMINRKACRRIFAAAGFSHMKMQNAN